MTNTDTDFDWLVIGSGFGGSVSALRLAEKGYRVGVIERGRRYRDEDLPKSTWELGKYFWMPTLGLKVIMRMRLFRHIFTPNQHAVGGHPDVGHVHLGAVSVHRGVLRWFRDAAHCHLSTGGYRAAGVGLGLWGGAGGVDFGAGRAGRQVSQSESVFSQIRIPRC